MYFCRKISLTTFKLIHYANIGSVLKNSGYLLQDVVTEIFQIAEEMTEKLKKTWKWLYIMISETDNDYSGPNYPGTVHCCNQTLQSQVHTTMVGTALQWGQVLLQSKTFKKLEFKMFIVWNMSCLFSVFSSAWAEFSFCLKFNLERRPDFRRKYKESSFKSSIRA